jgi:hypothetical protein
LYTLLWFVFFKVTFWIDRCHVFVVEIHQQEAEANLLPSPVVWAFLLLQAKHRPSIRKIKSGKIYFSFLAGMKDPRSAGLSHSSACSCQIRAILDVIPLQFEESDM